MFASTHLPVPELFGDNVITYNNQQPAYTSEYNTNEWNDANNVGAIHNGPSAIFMPSTMLNYASSASRQSLRLHDTNLCEEDEDLDINNGEPERHKSGSTLGMNKGRTSVQHHHPPPQERTNQHLQSSGWI